MHFEFMDLVKFQFIDSFVLDVAMFLRFQTVGILDLCGVPLHVLVA